MHGGGGLLGPVPAAAAGARRAARATPLSIWQQRRASTGHGPRPSRRQGGLRPLMAAARPTGDPGGVCPLGSASGQLRWQLMPRPSGVPVAAASLPYHPGPCRHQSSDSGGGGGSGASPSGGDGGTESCAETDGEGGGVGGAGPAGGCGGAEGGCVRKLGTEAGGCGGGGGA